MPERHEDARLSAFLDDELSDDDALDVTRHLVACELCLAELETIRVARSAVRGLPHLEPPDGLLASVQGVAAAVPRAPRLVAAALLGVGAVLALYLLGGVELVDLGATVDTPVADHEPSRPAILSPVDLEP
ncbi:MAG: zf-HC2 domain-containing protein [Nitriliruptorales bacterium]|nr:zf-HC2 domain-containing protein [Nitriliruptorales bacterium]